jgi:hypothetical protein
LCTPTSRAPQYCKNRESPSSSVVPDDQLRDWKETRSFSSPPLTDDNAPSHSEEADADTGQGGEAAPGDVEADSTLSIDVLLALERGSLILRTLPARTHLHQFRIEAAHDIDQIGLCGHDRVDVFVDFGDFIESGAQQGDVALGEQFLHGAPGEGLQRLGAAHHATRAV